MKLAVLSESPADEAAVRILVAALRGQADEVVQLAWRRQPGGWTGVLTTVEKAVLRLHYRREAEALVIVLDSDDTPIHAPDHEKDLAVSRDCRACEVLRALERAGQQLAASSEALTLRVAVGLAVPSMEAWLLCGTDPHVSEATWARKNGSCPYTRTSLKQALYKTDHPSLALERECMVKAAQRLAQAMSPLDRQFPIGFGLLCRKVRGW